MNLSMVDQGGSSRTEMGLDGSNKATVIGHKMGVGGDGMDSKRCGSKGMIGIGNTNKLTMTKSTGGMSQLAIS